MPTHAQMARACRMRESARIEREADAMREAQREAQRCEVFDDRDHYRAGAKYW